MANNSWCEFHCDCHQDTWQDISKQNSRKEKAISVPVNDKFGYFFRWTGNNYDEVEVYEEIYEEEKMYLLPLQTAIIRVPHNLEYKDVDIKIVNINSELPKDCDEWHYEFINYDSFK